MALTDNKERISTPCPFKVLTIKQNKKICVNKHGALDLQRWVKVLELMVDVAYRTKTQKKTLSYQSGTEMIYLPVVGVSSI